MSEADYRQLASIAPTIAPPSEYGDWLTPWDVQLRMVAQAVGKAAK